MEILINRLNETLNKYSESFSAKAYGDENNDHDILMDAFGITPDLKRENRQYWGRELGMCWQLLVIEVFKSMAPRDFSPALRFGGDEPCDLVHKKYAIDTKYRIGSGDSGTLKKFKQYGKLLLDNGYTPVFLIVREDNLSAAIAACDVGQWEVRIGDEAFGFIENQTGFDLFSFLKSTEDLHHILRSDK